MWHLKACKISFSLSFLNWVKNEMIFYRIAELMLPTLIQRYDKNHLISRTKDRLSGATFYGNINTIYQFIKPFLDKKKCLFLRNMEPLSRFTRAKPHPLPPEAAVDL